MFAHRPGHFLSGFLTKPKGSVAFQVEKSIKISLSCATHTVSRAPLGLALSRRKRVPGGYRAQRLRKICDQIHGENELVSMGQWFESGGAHSCYKGKRVTGPQNGRPPPFTGLAPSVLWCEPAKRGAGLSRLGPLGYLLGRVLRHRPSSYKGFGNAIDRRGLSLVIKAEQRHAL